MKVKCKTIYNEHTDQYQYTSPWLTIEKEYIVLAIEISPNKKILYRLIGDNSDKAPGLYDSKQFEIISGKLPSNWCISQINQGALDIGPVSWQPLGFWEDCYDGEPDALEIYKHETRIILGEEE